MSAQQQQPNFSNSVNQLRKQQNCQQSKQSQQQHLQVAINMDLATSLRGIQQQHQQLVPALPRQKSDQIQRILNTELRFIDLQPLRKLASIIDRPESWKALLEVIAQPNTQATNNKSMRLCADTVALLEQQVHCGKSPTIALLNYWSITGRRRPTIKTLVDSLAEANLLRAVDYICQNVVHIESYQILCQQQLSINCDSGVAIANNPRRQTTLANSHESLAYQLDSTYTFDDIEGLQIKDHGCQYYSFRSIYESTNGFCHKPYNAADGTGTKIGEGRFSSVFIANAHVVGCEDERHIVAAKLLKNESNRKNLMNEIKLIKDLKHTNLLELLGVAQVTEFKTETLSQAQHICLVYPYICNGSLLDCLQFGLASEQFKPIDWNQRLLIAVKVARGLIYLHTQDTNNPIVHRDVKTANILIGENCEPKLGDFTLVRQFSSTDTNGSASTQTIKTSQMTQTVIGTTVYMPPEAFRGDISTKFDAFSFGIVTLELLTGMKPFNEERNEDLFTIIYDRLSDIDDEIQSQEVDDSGMEANSRKGNLLSLNDALEIPQSTPTSQQSTNFKLQQEKGHDVLLKELLDKKAGRWDFAKAKILFKISLATTESRKKARPELKQLKQELESLLLID